MTAETPARLTPESKAQLRTTVRTLRESLVRELRTSVDQTYLLQLPTAKASARLSADRRERRRRLEEALAQRAQEDGGTDEARERALMEAVKETGATLLNRLVLIRHMEAMGLSRPAVVSGGWKSPGYVEFRRYAGALCEDDTQGYGVLLQLVFDELAQALPGLFGDVGFTKLIPVPPETLRSLVEALDGVSAEAWRDDMTLGWVYQYWNDPDREVLDAKLNDGGRIEHHEIASKTQMFTERYMVEWLLQNSLGATWLATCRKNGWKAEVEAKGVLVALDLRRAEWRRRRESGQVESDALMPINGPIEEAWKYYVPQVLTDETVKNAPESLRKLKLLDPACGSGHFLVVAFDLLVELYREEARHRAVQWSDRHISEWILEDNLHGVDIDTRAVQIAAAAIFLKAKALARDASPGQVNLVAPTLRLSSLSKDDPALVRLEKEIRAETGIPSELTGQIIEVLEGVDHLGTLLKVGNAVDKAIEAHQGSLSRTSSQSDLFEPSVANQAAPVTRADAKNAVLDRLNAFLSSHAGEENLGLRLRGQQLAAGVRFAGIVKEAQFHVVVGNPPYQGTSRLQEAGYVSKHYPRAKADLYTAFIERGLELCRDGGALAMVTLQGWMFITQFEGIRDHLLKHADLRVLADLRWCAFEQMRHNTVSMFVVRASIPSATPAVALSPTDRNEREESIPALRRKRAALLAQVGRFEFETSGFDAVEGRPIVYWWSREFLDRYSRAPKLGAKAPVRFGLTTGDNSRFVRLWHETSLVRVPRWEQPAATFRSSNWVPFVLGGKGRTWLEPLHDVIRWRGNGLEVKEKCIDQYGTLSKQIRSEDLYFQRGVAFSPIGSEFSARAHRYPSVMSNSGCSVFGNEYQLFVCLMNTTVARNTLESLNPGIKFEVGDVSRLPVLPVPNFSEIFAQVDSAFDLHEASREGSVEFRRPGPSAWAYAQTWAQEAIDRADGAPLPPCQLQYDAPQPVEFVSFALGVALGRFGSNGEGLLEKASPASLPNGLLFLSARAVDSLNHPACAPLLSSWEQHGLTVGNGDDLRTYLRTSFFEFHKSVYENRPIYWPVCSSRRSFVAYISIHRWTDSTLSALLADHLVPERKALEGTLVDLQADRTSTDRKARANAEKRYVQHKKWLEELEEFIAQVRQCAEEGPPQPDDKTPPREVDAPFRLELDDGVMINSSALWPLLEPMWKEPKRWWKELAAAKGRKDYDWSHLAARYFPDRVEQNCKKDPSLAVAHGCFWKYFPDKAYQWELRLRNEIGPEFRIDEPESDALRAAFLKKNAAKVHELEAAELARRDRRSKRQDQDELDLEDANAGDEAEDLSA